jgi:predicted Ser/Thr protein kinase
MQDLTGKMLGNYQILEELGRGGMAVVYRAYQASLNRYVAVKVLPPQLSFDQEFVERFLREARAAAGLRHPNIVVIHDVGQEGGVYYIVMEYLEGRTLKEVIEQEGALPAGRVKRIVEQIAAALDYAHQRGFVHRDVKPANIFVGEGDRVTLTDFGIAKAGTETQHLTRTGILMGTPEYMSPEQAAGGVVDHRADLYALGVVLYQMLVGRVPYRGTTPHATLHAVIYEAPPMPRQLNPGLGAGLEAVVLKAIAKRPEDRYQRGMEMVAALREVLATAGVRVPAGKGAAVAGGVPPKVVGRAEGERKRKRGGSGLVWILGGMAAVLVLLLGILILLVTQGQGTATPLPPTMTSFAWITPTAESGEVAMSPGPTDLFTATEPPVALVSDTPTNTPEPAIDTPAPPSDTPVPPSDTPKPPTDTPVPTKTHTPTPTTPPPPPPCAFDAHGLFAALWQTYRDQLGCPLYESPKVIQDAEQAFDNGHMFWRQDNDYAYAVLEKGPQAGTYQSFSHMWSEGDPQYSCAASPPAGRVQPIRGFGAVWCDLGGPSAAIGWGLGDEQGFYPGYGDPTVQDFENGMIFRDSDGGTTGKAYVFFSSSGTFKRVNY